MVTDIGTVRVIPPNVAETRTLTVPVGISYFFFVSPQPVRAPMVTMPIITERASAFRRRLSPIPKNGSNSRLIDARLAALTVVTVMLVVAVPPSETETSAGENVHLAPIGRPEHANVTSPSAPFSEVTETVVAEEANPLLTLNDATELLSVKSGPSPLIVSVWIAEEDAS